MFEPAASVSGAVLLSATVMGELEMLHCTNLGISNIHDIWKK
jgi:hypothetical protein